MNEDSRRLFFALWPDDDTREELARVAHAVPLHRAARRVPPEKMHITLAFMGDTPADRQKCFEQAADSVTGEPLHLTLDFFGHFPRPRVFWFGLKSTPTILGELVDRLVLAIEPCGFEPESRPFRPHVTLARKVRERPQASPATVEWPCDAFCLVESAGGKYSVLRRWPLK